MEKLKDIKANLIIEDYSFYLFVGICILVFALFVLLFYFIFKYFKNKKYSKEKLAYKTLTNLSFQDSKKTAYEISRFLPILSDSDDKKTLANKMIQNLEKYKYKKQNLEFAEEDKELLRKFLGMCDV